MRNLLSLLVFVVTHVSAVESEPIVFEYENDIASFEETDVNNLDEGLLLAKNKDEEEGE